MVVSLERTMLALGAAFIVALLVVRAVRTLAIGRQLLDQPNWRSSHSVPTPRLGGIGIVAGVWLGSLMYDGLHGPTLTLLVPATILAAFGLVDDLRSLSPIGRLAVQAATAIAAMWVMHPEIEVGLAGLEVRLDGVVAMLAGAVWVVGVVNVFNFMDGIDGIAGGTAAAGAAALILLGAPPAVMLAIVGASLGFLVWNQSPASIFMGDGGSMCLGTLLALGPLAAPGDVSGVGMILVLAPFLLDASFTLAIRSKDRKPLLAAHHEHLYQRLATVGVDRRVIAAGYWAAAMVCGWLGIRYATADASAQVAIIVGVLAAFAAYVLVVRRLERQTVAGGFDRDVR